MFTSVRSASAISRALGHCGALPPASHVVALITAGTTIDALSSDSLVVRRSAVQGSTAEAFGVGEGRWPSRTLHGLLSRVELPFRTAHPCVAASHRDGPAGRRCSPDFFPSAPRSAYSRATAAMILWQKQASAEWLVANERRLEIAAGTNLAVISRPGQTRSLVEVSCRGRAKAERLIREFGGLARPLPRNWLQIAQSSQARGRIRIGRRLEIVNRPARSLKRDSKLQLVIPAAGAFGTGEHATTAMSLRLLEEATRNIPRGWRLLDAGTGTGILALAARRLGAGKVLGLDDDPRAVAHARQNARLNRISRATFLKADILGWKPSDRYDLITANLFNELLIAALPIFRRALLSGGRLIVSGILREQNASVVRALRRFGFRIETARRRGKWIALLCRPAFGKRQSAYLEVKST